MDDLLIEVIAVPVGRFRARRVDLASVADDLDFLGLDARVEELLAISDRVEWQFLRLLRPILEFVQEVKRRRLHASIRAPTIRQEKVG